MTGSTRPNRPFLLGVAGGSGSGKTHFARALQRELGERVCSLVFQDNFYVDQSKRFDFDGGAVNFDHPDAIDFRLLVEKIACLRRGEAAEIPVYDFVTHSRRTETLRIPPSPVVIVDGILIFHSPELRALFDERIFFDAAEELRFQRRLERDVQERGRTPEGVRNQFDRQVKPMHDQFVQPSLAHASRVVCDQGDYERLLREFCARLKR